MPYAASAYFPDGSPQSLTLAGLRQDLELLAGPITAGIGQTWRIRDPARNKFFEIGPFEFAVFSVWQEGLSLADLSQRVSARLKTSVEPEELMNITEFLMANELLSVSSASVRRALVRRAQGRKTGWLRWLLQNYLFMRIPLFNPEPMLAWLSGKTNWLFTQKALFTVIVLTIVDLHLLSEKWPQVVHHIDYSFSLEGLVMLAVAGILSKTLHEFGHALVAHRLGVRVPAMGLSMVVMYPMLYTDTGDSWRLRNKNQRLAIASAGMIAEFSLALIAILAWSLFPDGPVRNALFFLAFVGALLALGLNAMPFMRFDGYYVLSDALDLPNLHERASALSLRWIRFRVWGLLSSDPETQMSLPMRCFLIVFAMVTWLYRLVVYLAIAWLVFDYFFKALGIVLMLVELGWFVVRPVYQEISYLAGIRQRIRPNWLALLVTAMMIVVFTWLWFIASGITSPAIARARTELIVKSPKAGLLLQLNVREGQRLEVGDELALLVSPESDLRTEKAQINRKALLWELQSAAANQEARERSETNRQRIKGTQAAEQLSISEQDLMHLRASAPGTVRDLHAGAVAGRWIQAREPLLRVISTEGTVIYAYVNEANIHDIKMGASATFYPDDAGIKPIRGKVVELDTNSLRTLPSPLLSSVYQGAIASVRGPSGELTTSEARYKVRIEPEEPTALPRVLRGSVYIEGNALSAITALPARIISNLKRELGI